MAVFLKVLGADCLWVAYASDQSGRFEIYVESFPTPAKRVQASTDGGTQPRWRRDQKELYFLSANGRLIAVPASLGAEAKLGNPAPLFTPAVPAAAIGWKPFYYDVSDDGRFLAAIVEPHVAERPPITIAFNATAGLKLSPSR